MAPIAVQELTTCLTFASTMANNSEQTNISLIQKLTDRDAVLQSLEESKKYLCHILGREVSPPLPPQKKAYLWKSVNPHKVWGFVRRPVKLRSKKEEGMREEKIK